MKKLASKLIFLIAITFVGCGSKISGTYTISILGIEGGYKFSGSKAVKFSSISEEVTGSFSFDETSNTILIQYDEGGSEQLYYNPNTGNISNGDFTFRKK